MIRLVISPAYQKYNKDFRSIPKWMAEGKGEIVHEGRNSVRKFLINNQLFMVKRFKRVNQIQSIAYSLFRKTKAERAFIYAEAYRKRGIDTPKEVAFIEIRNNWGWFRDGYFISLVSPNPPVFPLLEQTDKYEHQLVNDLANMVFKMHQAGILNKDLNLGNFLYQKKEGKYYFTMVDINRTTLVNKVPDENRRLKNLCTITCKQDLFQNLLDSYLAITEKDSNTVQHLREIGIKHWKKRQEWIQIKSKFKSVIKSFKLK